MVKERLEGRRGAAWIAAVLLAATLVCPHVSPAADDAPDRPIRLVEATQRGAFNVGAATADVGVVSQPATGGDVVRLTFTIPPGTAAGLWTKGWPAGASADRVDVVRVAATADRAETAGEIAATLEIKGSAGVQRIALRPSAEGLPVQDFVDWHAVGTLAEVVVSVSRNGEGEPARGSLDIDLSFERLSPLRRLSTSEGARVVGVVGLAAVLLLAASFLRHLPRVGSGLVPSRVHALGRDFCLGVGVAAIGALGVAVNALGGMGRLEIGWWPLVVAGAGVVVAWGLKLGLTGAHLTPGEVFRDALATGLCAAGSSPLSILQPAGTWGQMIELSQSVATALVLVYHGANLYRLTAAGKHLGAVGGSLILATPFVIGILLLLESRGLLADIAGAVGLGGEGTSHLGDFVARVLVVFAFNEAVVNGIALGTSRTLLRPARAHLALLGVAIAAGAGYEIAAVGSGPFPASLGAVGRTLTSVVATILSQSGLWAEAYLLTGLILDATRGASPTVSTVVAHPIEGARKGMVYSGTFMAILNVIRILVDTPEIRGFIAAYPSACGAALGAAVFPLLKAIVETFDGSQAFFLRVGKSYRKPVLYARGAVVGLGLGYALSHGLSGWETPARSLFGLVIGVTAFAGVNVLADLYEASRGRGRLQTWRFYLVQAGLGGFIGAAIGFYLDTVQVGVVVAKFRRYVEVGVPSVPFDDYPLLSKWGRIDLGHVSGGPALLFAEALAGVISWSIPAWLFAINRTFMAAFFRKESTPIRALFTREGMTQLVQNMIEVLRWGLWMSPIIKSFLRPMGEPTWYNQDGAIRTVVAVVHDATSTRPAFDAWSLGVFIALLAHDWVRILIWLDHMGLRVATLVNLSFLGMDALDRKLARFVSPAATARFIPEGVKRFTTWAPLLIPFYIPRGKDWDLAWSRSQAIIATEHGGLVATITAWPTSSKVFYFLAAATIATAGFAGTRILRRRAEAPDPNIRTLENADYQVVLKENGEIYSRVRKRDFDLTRRSYDGLDPAGRTLFLIEDDASGRASRHWHLIGNVPGEVAEEVIHAHDAASLTVCKTREAIRSTIEITLAGGTDAAEVWAVTLENLADQARRLDLVPYVEWVLNRPDADRSHTQYNRLFAEMEYETGLHAVLAWDKHSKAMGILASDVTPAGFLTSRVDFIGRARSIWSPRVVETLDFNQPEDTDAHPTFDPIGSLLLGVDLPPRGSVTIHLLVGYAVDKAGAIELIASHLAIPGAGSVSPDRERKATHAIGHGAIPAGTPRPYFRYADDGRSLVVLTPFTTRPFDHTLSNALGQVTVVTNRGLHTSASVNAQQNRLTTDWADTVTREVPGEAFYLYDLDRRTWHAPTYHPINDPDASYEATFGVDGTAVFRMAKPTIETELTVFVPVDSPATIYRLTIRNPGAAPLRLRLTPYFQLVLAAQPEFAGPLAIRRDPSLNAVFYENPRNTFRTGPAFVAVSYRADVVETVRGRFFGAGRGVDRPVLVESGAPGPETGDDRPVAVFLTTVEVPPRGERTLTVLLGQADDRRAAEAEIRRLLAPGMADSILGITRGRWLDRIATLRVETDDPEFDRYLDWLRYQALAVRIWARRGFYQASGAFGFRDQLQDSVNLLWADPEIARRQILLHAAQQFPEGDVVHWFHLLQDGRTGFVGRSHASDNLLWLVWAVVEYVGATGDATILDERTPYLESEVPFEPLPKDKGGMGFDPLRSTVEDTVYRHCLRAIDLVLDRRMGAHGLPLIGTGDWNDGLDEIGSEGRGESVWLGLFLVTILDRFVPIVGRVEGEPRRAHYADRLARLRAAIEATWRGDRYLRAINDDGVEIGVKGSGVWEIDALTAAWAVMAGVDHERGKVVFETAVLEILERETTILLGWPPLREDTEPYLGRSSWYPEGVRENGMYCHGVQWLVGAARILARRAADAGRADEAARYDEAAWRIWQKISAIPHTTVDAIETYGGPPNQQAADMVTTFEPGRMIWNGYTGAAGWVFRQALEGVLGLGLVANAMVPPRPGRAAGPRLIRVERDLSPVSDADEFPAHASHHDRRHNDLIATITNPT